MIDQLLLLRELERTRHHHQGNSDWQQWTFSPNACADCWQVMEGLLKLIWDKHPIPYAKPGTESMRD